MNADERNVVAEIIEERMCMDDNEPPISIITEEKPSILDQAFPLSSETIVEDIPEILSSSTNANTEEETVAVDINRIECTICTSSFSNRGNLQKHMRKKHNKLNKFEKDALSNVKISTENKVSDERVSQGELHNCDKCDFTSSNSDLLKTHVQSKHKVEKDEPMELVIDDEPHNSRPFKCPDCEKSFSSPKLLRKHKKKCKVALTVSSDPVEQILKCNLCNFSCSKETSLKIHKTMKHKKQENVDKMLVSKNLFKSKSVLAGSNFKCHHCDYVGSDKKDLRKHRFQTHRHEFIKKSKREDKNEHSKEADESMDLSESTDGEQEVSSSGDVTLNERAEPGAGVEMDSKLLTEADKSSAEVSSETNAEESPSVSESKTKIYDAKKKELLEKSEHFRLCPGNIQINRYKHDDDSIEVLPGNFGLKRFVTPSGRKWVEYITPDKILKLRSMKAVYEYLRCSGNYNEDEVKSIEAQLKAHSS